MVVAMLARYYSTGSMRRARIPFKYSAFQTQDHTSLFRILQTFYEADARIPLLLLPLSRVKWMGGRGTIYYGLFSLSSAHNKERQEWTICALFPVLKPTYSNSKVSFGIRKNKAEFSRFERNCRTVEESPLSPFSLPLTPSV